MYTSLLEFTACLLIALATIVGKNSKAVELYGNPPK